MSAIPIDVHKVLAREPLLDPPLNDHGNALRIRALFGENLLYSHAEKCWFVWDERRWARDVNGAALRLAKNTGLQCLTVAVASGDTQTETFAKRSLDQGRLVNALASLQCELPIDVNDFDNHRHLLNFLNGTVDLRSGTIRPHDKTDKLTRLIHRNFVPEGKCPPFLGFLERVMGGGPDAGEAANCRAEQLIGYLQKAIGYSLTGETSEKVVFIAHGNGNNGKSTLLDTIRQLIPEYSSKIMIDSLMLKPGGESANTLTDLADLRGARFVSTSETEYGQRLSEGRLKRITQGMGTIKAVRKYENPITFPETHKLWIDANHLPVISGSENAIWNRLHAIPFAVVIPPEEIDLQLPAKLLSEAEGILAWCVIGAKRWYAEGLGKPAAVSDAVAGWREDMNPIGPFLEDLCELNPDDPNAWVKVSEMWKAYSDWAERNDEKRPLSQQGLAAQLESRGVRRGKRDDGRTRVWRGIRFSTMVGTSGQVGT